MKLALSIENLVQRVESFEVRSDEESQQLNDLLGNAKYACNRLEADRVARKEPVLAEGRMIDSLYEPSKTAFKRLESVAKAKLKKWMQAKMELEAERKAEAEQKRLAAEEALRKAEEQARTLPSEETQKALAVASVDFTFAEMQTAPSAPVTVDSSFAKSGMRYRKIVKVTDLSQVPRQYLEATYNTDPKPLERVLMAAFKSGEVAIPGVLLYEEPEVVTRAGMR